MDESWDERVEEPLIGEETDHDITMISGRPFQIGPRYLDGVFIGEGAYGMVISAVDSLVPGGERVAIKKVTPLQHETFCQRTLRELLILKRLKHENIINLINVIVPQERPLNEIYLVLNIMETDLHKLLKSLRRREEYLGEQHRCFFMYQIMLALKFIHSANVLHRDLKPANILINTSNCDLRICDFGLARVRDPSVDHSGRLTEYVATRWYRAPEVMVQQRSYGIAMDMWSVGCIFAEMFNNRPLFPGKNYVEQLNKILDILGSPSKQDLNEIPNERSRRYVAALPPREAKPFPVLYPNATETGINLLHHLLTFSPTQRISATDSLAHAYFEDYHDPEDEPVAPLPFTFDCEIDALPVDELQERIILASEDFSGRS
eukprot:m.102742 g.102742  ORF g.102742 m.102742 type:complete len:377 (-) comp9085_c0_seq1:6573-7703(-)